MDRLVAEKEVETLVETQKVTAPKQVENKVENTMPTFQTNFDGKFNQNNFVYQTQKVEEKKPLDKMEGARSESYVQYKNRNMEKRRIPLSGCTRLHTGDVQLHS